MTHDIDIFVANYDTLPWLRLYHRQFTAFPPKAKARLFVWDNNSQDGSKEWLASSGVEHLLHTWADPHSKTIAEYLKLAQAPLVCIMDVDAIPFAHGWLDDAIEGLDEKTGAVGLFCGSQHGIHRAFVHPSFCVFRMETLQRLGLSFNEKRVEVEGVTREYYDVGELFSQGLERAGFVLKCVGGSKYHPDGLKRWNQKIAHFYGATAILADRKFDDKKLVGISKQHLELLSQLGLLEAFTGYLRDVAPKNPRANKYEEFSRMT